MEYRIFYPLTDDAFDLWKHLGLSSSQGTCERREDAYIVNSASVGLKDRGSSGRIELKLRLERLKRGAEHWVKTTVATSGSVVDTPVAMILKKHGKELPESDLQESIRIADELKPAPVVLTKKSVCKQMVGGISVEQTDLEVIPQGATSGQRFRTVCVEGGKAPKLYDFVEKHQLVQILYDVVVKSPVTSTKDAEMEACALGYPGFVHIVWKNFVKQPSSF